jgi:hypothetical protein
MMARLKANLNGLHPSWKKRPHFTAQEERELFENRIAWMDVQDDEWPLLNAYMAAIIPEAWKGSPRDFFQPDNRLAMIRSGPTSMLGFAENWQRRCKREGIATGLEPTQQIA